LAEIQKASADLRDTEPTFKEVEEGFEQFCESVKPKNMSKELQDQFVRDRAAFQKLVDELGEVNRKILEVDSTIETMETAEMDYKKAAALLKIPSQYLSKLKAALEGLSSSLEKALDALAREAGLKSTGKEMMALLRRAKMLS
jgi:seryl-tRNA synthetase